MAFVDGGHFIAGLGGELEVDGNKIHVNEWVLQIIYNNTEVTHSNCKAANIAPGFISRRRTSYDWRATVTIPYDSECLAFYDFAGTPKGISVKLYVGQQTDKGKRLFYTAKSALLENAKIVCSSKGDAIVAMQFEIVGCSYIYLDGR